MPSPPSRVLTVEGVDLTLEVERKRVKNVNARLTGRHLRVSAPLTISAGELERIVGELARTLLRRRRQREINRGDGLLKTARRIASRFPQAPDVREVWFSTTQRARWGSYAPAMGSIRLHAALASMPSWVLEAVIAHELAHVFHRDHSPAFWELLRAACPDADRARAFLAGVSWLARRWESLAPSERVQLGAGQLPDDEGDA